MADVKTSTRPDWMTPEMQDYLGTVPEWARDDVMKQMEAQATGAAPSGPVQTLITNSMNGGAGDPSQPQYPDEILDLLSEDRATANARFDELEPGRDAIFNAGQEANTRDQAIIDALKEREAGIKDPVLAPFTGDWESTAAKGDPEARGMQRAAGKKLKGWMDPRITDREQAMMEMSRRSQERDQRASREATLASLRDRGFGSGGDEIASMLGSQQETGNRRMLEDLATRGQAVDRSLVATDSYGRLGTQMREGTYREGTAADVAAQSNRDGRELYNHRLVESQRNANTDSWGRTIDVGTAEAGASDDTYNRSLDPWEWQAGLTGDRNESEAGNTESTIKAAGDKYGAELAAYSAWLTRPKKKKKGGIFGTGFGPDIG